jgi:hypothetical protein
MTGLPRVELPSHDSVSAFCRFAVGSSCIVSRCQRIELIHQLHNRLRHHYRRNQLFWSTFSSSSFSLQPVAPTEPLVPPFSWLGEYAKRQAGLREGSRTYRLLLLDIRHHRFDLVGQYLLVLCTPDQFLKLDRFLASEFPTWSGPFWFGWFLRPVCRVLLMQSFQLRLIGRQSNERARTFERIAGLVNSSRICLSAVFAVTRWSYSLSKAQTLALFRSCPSGTVIILLSSPSTFFAFESEILNSLCMIPRMLSACVTACQLIHVSVTAYTANPLAA